MRFLVDSLARERTCVLVTNDKDFGELVFLYGKRIPGALLVRLPGRSGEEKAPMVRAAINETGSRILRHFVVVEPGSAIAAPPHSIRSSGFQRTKSDGIAKKGAYEPHPAHVTNSPRASRLESRRHARAPKASCSRRSLGPRGPTRRSRGPPP